MPRIMPACVIAGVVMVGDCDTSATCAPAGSIAFARPKSSTFTVPSGRTLMLAGLRSRWMMPCSCAASSASAICFAIGSASSSGMAPRAIRCDEIVALDEFHDERGEVWCLLQSEDLRDVRMVERGEHFCFALKAREPIRVAGDCGRQHLDRDLAFQVRVGGLIHLAHPTNADLRGDVVDAEARAGSECQTIGIIWADKECGRDHSRTRRRVDLANPAEAPLPLATTRELAFVKRHFRRSGLTESQYAASERGSDEWSPKSRAARSHGGAQVLALVRERAALWP